MLLIMKNRIYTILLIMFLGALSDNLRAQTVIPYLPMQNNFAGNSVQDLSEFSLPVGDFTLEVSGCISEQEISVGDGYIVYTPVESGTVRFAKYADKVYVYENGIYKTTVIPGPLSITYSSTNLFQNSGFETVVPNPDDGSNYMDGVYWHVYKVPEIEYWKNAGSVRTTKYEGSYSLLMRNEGIYLTQSLGNLLKSNTYYKISYYHRSSTVAQGGSSYQIELGSTEFGTDGGVFPAHTTSVENTAWTLFETEIQTSDLAPTWFTLHRLITGNKYDYLDSFCILEGSMNARGIRGATTATCLEGAAYAPEIVLGADDTFDMTSYCLMNSDFEIDSSSSSSADFVPTGWSGTYAVSVSKISTGAKGNGLIEGSPNLHYQIYNGNGISGQLFQRISGLPAGSYKVQAVICPGNTEGVAFLYANAGKTSVTTNNVYEAEGIVTDSGELEIGIDIAKTGVTTIDIDHFKLYYSGKYNEPVIVTDATYLSFSADNTQRTFIVNAYGLTSDIILAAPVNSGISFNPNKISPDNSQNVIVTATFDAANLASYHINTGVLTLTSEGAHSATITFSADPLRDVIPYLPMKNDFGGSSVNNLANFVPSVEDFTLEVTGAVTGQEINVGDGYFSYIPTTDGVVRFVQKGDLSSNVVFVYENGKYKTKITPTQVKFSSKNLFKNNGFETVIADGSNYKDGIYWNVCNSGKTATWQTDGSVRSSRKSEGTYSLLMRSPAVYLTQLLEGLKSDTYYQISYFYSSNEPAQGGAEYQIELGSSQFGTDGGIYPAHTTSTENKDWMKYETVIKTGDSSPLWFTLHRLTSGNIFDWYDDFAMFEGVFSIGNGITGVVSATYLEAAYAPETVVETGNKYDMTYHFVVNPEFEKDLLTNDNTGFAPVGWRKTFNPTTSKISASAKGDGATIVAGQNHWQTFCNGSVTGKMYQIVSGLPSGKYLLRAGVYPSFEGAASLYAGNAKTALENKIGAYYEVESTVCNGLLEFGIDLATTSTTAEVDLDHISLIYLGEDVEGYKQALQEKLAIGNAAITDEGNPGYYNQQQLQDAIDKGNSVLSALTSASLLEAITALDAAISDYDAIRAAYKPLKMAIGKANELLLNTDYPCKGDYQNAVNTSVQVYGSTTDQRSYLESALAALNAATNAYYDCAPLPSQQLISCVDTSLDGSQKYVLRIDGKPFYMNNVQVRFDKLRHILGWNAEKIESVFARIAADNFNAITIAMHWIEVEPEKDVFDWTVLDEYLSLAKKYNLKLELLWMGSNSGGRVQALVGNTLRTPSYVLRKTAAGSEYPTASDYSIRRDMTDYSLDMADTNLRDRETLVVSKVMNHVAVWDAANGSTHPLVGIQLGNEVKGYGVQFDEEVIVSYWNHVGAAVKNSPYVIWTRMNCIEGTQNGRYAKNEEWRANGGTNIDIVGIDLYRKTAKQIREYIPYLGKNFRYIMECGANDPQGAILKFAALSGNNSFNYYNFVGTESLELYDIMGDIYIPHGDYVDDVRTVNRLFKSANIDLAINAQGYGLFVHNWEGKSATATTGVEGIVFEPASSLSQAVSVRHSNTEIVLMNTKGGKFTYPETLGVTGASIGYFDHDNNWVDEGGVDFTSTSIIPPRASVVKLTHVDSGEMKADYTYQAEFAGQGSGATVSTTPSYLGFAGNGAVLFPSSGGYIEWTDVNGGGSSNIIRLRYALAGSVSLTGKLLVNGTSQEIIFEPTGANDVYRTVAITTSLTNGANNILRLEPSSTELSGLYIDELQIVHLISVSIYEGNGNKKTVEIPKDCKGLSDALTGNAIAIIDDANGLTLPEGQTNVVIKNANSSYFCTNLLLTDKEPFYTPVTFTAENATYKRDLTGYIYANGTNGWTSLILPFAGILYADEDKKQPFTSDNDTEGHYWLKTFAGKRDDSTMDFEYADCIQADTPYIIALPGDYWGENNSVEKKDIEVRATDVMVSATTGIPATAVDSYSFKGTYTTYTSDDTYYVLNENGNSFVKSDAGKVEPFRCYLLPVVQQKPLPEFFSIGGGDGDITGVEEQTEGYASKLHVYVRAGDLIIGTPKSGTACIYTAAGVLVRSVQIQEGVNTVTGLVPGFYIVEGKKVVIFSK